jgi:cell division protein FtsW (lipid II flippase)
MMGDDLVTDYIRAVGGEGVGFLTFAAIIAMTVVSVFTVYTISDYLERHEKRTLEIKLEELKHPSPA